MALSAQTRAKVPRLAILGTPVHAPLTDYPVTFLTVAPVCDLAALAGHKPAGRVGALAVAAGIATALPAALTGTLDWLRVPEREPGKGKGIVHAALNSAALVSAAGSLWARRSDPSRPHRVALGLSALAAGLVTASAHLGGELTYRYGIRAEQAQPLVQVQAAPTR